MAHNTHDSQSCNALANHTVKFPLPALFSANEAVSVKQSVHDILDNNSTVDLLILDFGATTFRLFRV